MKKFEKFKLGDTVRAHDFEGNLEVGTINACYVEGIVVDIVRVVEIGGCMCYKLKCTKKVFGGEEIKEHKGEIVFSPVNGTKTFFGKELNQVVLVEAFDEDTDPAGGYGLHFNL
jgi:hypothetical protein